MNKRTSKIRARFATAFIVSMLPLLLDFLAYEADDTAFPLGSQVGIWEK
jgi:hypothetical protein